MWVLIISNKTAHGMMDIAASDDDCDKKATAWVLTWSRMSY